MKDEFLKICKDRVIGVMFDKDHNNYTFGICDKKVQACYDKYKYPDYFICKKILSEILDIPFDDVDDNKICLSLDSKDWFAGMKIIHDKIQYLKELEISKWHKEEIEKLKRVKEMYIRIER